MANNRPLFYADPLQRDPFAFDFPMQDQRSRMNAIHALAGIPTNAGYDPHSVRVQPAKAPPTLEELQARIDPEPIMAALRRSPLGSVPGTPPAPIDYGYNPSGRTQSLSGPASLSTRAQQVTKGQYADAVQRSLGDLMESVRSGQIPLSPEVNSLAEAARRSGQEDARLQSRWGGHWYGGAMPDEAPFESQAARKLREMVERERATTARMQTLADEGRFFQGATLGRDPRTGRAVFAERPRERNTPVPSEEALAKVRAASGAGSLADYWASRPEAKEKFDTARQTRKETQNERMERARIASAFGLYDTGLRMSQEEFLAASDPEYARASLAARTEAEQQEATRQMQERLAQMQREEAERDRQQQLTLADREAKSRRREGKQNRRSQESIALAEVESRKDIADKELKGVMEQNRITPDKVKASIAANNPSALTPEVAYQIDQEFGGQAAPATGTAAAGVASAPPVPRPVPPSLTAGGLFKDPQHQTEVLLYNRDPDLIIPYLRGHGYSDKEIDLVLRNSQFGPGGFASTTSPTGWRNRLVNPFYGPSPGYTYHGDPWIFPFNMFFGDPGVPVPTQPKRPR